MDYLTFIDRITRRAPAPFRAQFLVSGSDPAIRNAVLEDVARECREAGRALLVIDDTGNGEIARLLRSCGYSVQQGFSEARCLWDPLQAGTVKGLSQLRQLLTVLEYDERQKNKLAAYLRFITHIESLWPGGRAEALTAEELGACCTAMAVEELLQALVEQGAIDEDRRMALLVKYSECAAAAADFEDVLLLLTPFIRGEPLEPEAGQALIFRVDALGEDETLRDVVLHLLRFNLEQKRNPGISVAVLDKGYGQRKNLFNFLKELPPHVPAHLFSEDVFTLCGPADLAMLFNRFSVRIYSRHPVMSSAEAVEQACGEMDVVKNSYHVTYDRRWSANRPWDVLMGRSKTESYAQSTPMRESRYRKEMIVRFSPGTGIVECMGNASLFAV